MNEQDKWTLFAIPFALAVGAIVCLWWWVRKGRHRPSK